MAGRGGNAGALAGPGQAPLPQIRIPAVRFAQKHCVLACCAPLDIGGLGDNARCKENLLISYNVTLVSGLCTGV
jgi:hypothetical protein